ncbi:MAG: DUF86 domain-containing protein [Candidatus Eisenbacteria bacterium]|nr:DUF86 domain-containing protein [Candidatus Eisenbacteria bacterium]
MIDSARLILSYVKGKTEEDFATTISLQDQVIRRFQVIGEAARHVSPETRERLSEIPWKAIVGLRNVLIHEYGEINLGLVWKTIEGLPDLVEALAPHVPFPTDPKS